MDNLQQLLQLSAKLYQKLNDTVKGNERDSYIEEINQLLDQRGKLIEILQKKEIQLNAQNKTHAMLIELDQGIRNRLDCVMQEVKNDLKNLQNSKKSEKQYINPYASIRVMDGMYYDKKK